MNAVRPIPTGMNQFIMIICIVENYLRLDVTDRGLVLRILLDQVFDQLAILRYIVFHSMMTSSAGSNVFLFDTGIVMIGLCKPHLKFHELVATRPVLG